MPLLAAQELLLKYDRPVPRYTSYPTAPHFRHPASQLAYREWLGDLPEDQDISLYIHIPFCRHLCLYCGCHTQVVDRPAPIHEYLNTLQQEITLVAEAIGRRQKVSCIHFGGGTPNFAATDDLDALLNMVAQKFVLSNHIEIAMEMDPRILTREKTQMLTQLGINRASLGVQDFQPEVQAAINRIQPYEHVRSCVAWLREAGVASINFDMIYGLPLQTVDKMRDNMARVCELRPDRVALFGYAHVPWLKEHQRKLEEYSLPDVAARFEMAEAARADLIRAGYVPIGIDHFSLPGDALAVALKEKNLHRNFQGYTADSAKTLISFGQTAISQYHSAYVQNTSGNREYRESVTHGDFPLARACLLSPEDIFRRDIIENIMCYGEVDLMALNNAHQWADVVWETAYPALFGMEKDGLVDLGDMDVVITAQGRALTRLVASTFDYYLQHGNGVERHVRAI